MPDHDDESGEEPAQQGRILGLYPERRPYPLPLSAVAFYFFHQWGRDGALGFPSFRQPEGYYDLFVFPSSIKMPTRPLSYHTQFEWNRKIVQRVGIHSKERPTARASRVLGTLSLTASKRCRSDGAAAGTQTQ